jgi:hypothetical protein
MHTSLLVFNAERLAVQRVWRRLALIVILAYIVLLLVVVGGGDGVWRLSPRGPVAPLWGGCSSVPVPC